MAENADSAWSAILDEMESDLARDIGLGQPVTWSVPLNVWPLPEHLVDRAKRVLDAQQRAIDALAGDQKTIGRHLAALRAVPPTLPTGRAVYLDVVG